MKRGRTQDKKEPVFNQATRTTAAALGVVFGIGGMGHGIFEMLQGYKPTTGLVIEAIGPAQRMWEYGNEPAFTIIPNYLITGIVAILVSLAIIAWSVGFLHRKGGPTIFLSLFALSFLVGAGIGQVIFFFIGWAFATRIRKPLAWWRRALPAGSRKALVRLWPAAVAVNSVLILFALEIAIFGLVPGVDNPDSVTLVMLSSLAAGLSFLFLAFISGFAHDIEKGGVPSGKKGLGGACIEAGSHS